MAAAILERPTVDSLGGRHLNSIYPHRCHDPTYNQTLPLWPMDLLPPSTSAFVACDRSDPRGFASVGWGSPLREWPSIFCEARVKETAKVETLLYSPSPRWPI